MTHALPGVLLMLFCLLQSAYGLANLGPEVRDPANFLPPRIFIGADLTTTIKPSRPQTLDRQATASGIPDFLSREPLGESESINLYSYCHNDPVNGVDVLGLKTKRFTNLGIEELEKIWGKGFFESWVQRQGYSPVARQDWMETQTDFFDQYVAGLGYSPIEGSYSGVLNAPIVNPIHHGTHQYFMWQGSGGENLYIVPHNFWGKSQTPFGWSVSDTWEEAAAEIKQQAFYGSGVLETSRNVIGMGTGATQGNLIGMLGRLRAPVNPPMLMRPDGRSNSPVSLTNSEVTNVPSLTRFWTRSEHQGTRIYQRNDLFNPNLMTSWRERGQVIRGTNIERMATGRAPIGHDGQSVNLHHTIQTANGPIAEVLGSFHQRHYSIIHINTGALPSGINRSLFDVWREGYWMQRSTGF